MTERTIARKTLVRVRGLGVGSRLGISSTSSQRTSIQEGPHSKASTAVSTLPTRCQLESSSPVFVHMHPDLCEWPVHHRWPPVTCRGAQLVLVTKTFMQPEYIHLISKPSVCGDIAREPAHRRPKSHGLISDRPLGKVKINCERGGSCSRFVYRIAKTTYSQTATSRVAFLLLTENGCFTRTIYLE